MKNEGCIDTDKGMDEIRKQLAALGKLGVKAGVVEGSGSEDGVDIAQYGAYNEYGVPGKKQKWAIPPRPFIRGFVENNSADIKATVERLYKLVSEGKITADTAIKRLGQFAQDGIKRYMKSGDFEPNAESTIKRKGSSRPLFDKGALFNAIRYEIVEGGKK